MITELAVYLLNNIATVVFITLTLFGVIFLYLDHYTSPREARLRRRLRFEKKRLKWRNSRIIK